MLPDRRSQKIVIAGASSLLGADVKTLLEEGRFAGWDLRLVDEEDVAGTLTEAAGEPAVIQRIEEDTFKGARFAFLTGSTEFGKQCLGPAKQAGATVLDFSRASLRDPDATPWFPKIEALTGKTVPKNACTYNVFSAGGTAVASLALALRSAGLQQLVALLFHSVSEAGREGIEELEMQTSQLLSFQSVGQRVFDVQTAFNLLPKYGAQSRQHLYQRLLQMRAEVSAVLDDPILNGNIAMNLIHAPVFYGIAFSVWVALEVSTDVSALKQFCKDAGFVFVANDEPGPSNVSVAGEINILLSDPQPDPARQGSWWLWGVADNLRFPAASGCKLAEWLES
jgi:aspartate-semialdehyde dehydrogenase